MLEAGLKTHLLAKAGITNLVGQRIYAVVFPHRHNTWPSLVYRRLSRTGQRPYETNKQQGIVNAFIQLTVFATTYESAKNVAEAVRNEMSGFTGTMGSETVHASLFEDEGDGFQAASETGAATDLFVVDMVYSVKYTEATPTL